MLQGDVSTRCRSSSKGRTGDAAARGSARRRETEVPGLLSIRRYVQQRCFCRPARPGSRGGQVWEIAANLINFRTHIIIKEIVRYNQLLLVLFEIIGKNISTLKMFFCLPFTYLSYLTHCSGHVKSSKQK